jgi:outer membrane cobalamin receptor
MSGIMRRVRVRERHALRAFFFALLCALAMPYGRALAQPLDPDAGALEQPAPEPAQAPAEPTPEDEQPSPPGEQPPSEPPAAPEDEIVPPPRVDTELSEVSGMSIEELLSLDVRVSTPSLFQESSLETAATVDLAMPADWERRGARRTLDAIANLPGTALYPTVWGGTAVAVRGYASGSSVRGLALLLDGVPLNDIVYASALNFSSNVELPTLARIEMVRGPGSALYGTDAFHGVLAYGSFAPNADVREAGGEIGTDLYHRGFARISQGLGESLRLHMALGYSGLPDQSRGYAYTDPDTMMPGRGERALSFRSAHGVVSLVYAPVESRWDATFTFHNNIARANGAPGVGRTTDRSLLADRDVSRSNTELYLGRAEIGVTLPRRMRAEALAYFWYQDVFTLTPTLVPTLGGPARSDVRTEFAQSRTGGRLTFRQEMNAWHTQWVAGYELSRSRLDDGGQQTTIDPDSGISFLSASFLGSGFTRNIHSFFLSAQTRFAHDVVRIHYGGRIDHYSDFGVQGTPRLGFVVAPTGELAFKALYGRAFRAPSLFETRGDGADILTNTSLRPELIDTFELIAMYQTDRCRLQLTGFSSIWHGGITLVPIAHPSFRTQYENVGRNHALGVEASAAYLRGAFRVEASASYTRSWNDSDDVQYTAFPQLIANLGLGYELEAQRLSFYLFQRIQAGMTDGPESSASFRDQPHLPPYYRIDVNARWEAVEDHLTLFVNVRNVLARSNFVPSLSNAENGAPTQGINASIGAQASF